MSGASQDTEITTQGSLYMHRSVTVLYAQTSMNQLMPTLDTRARQQAHGARPSQIMNS
jgi:hypothetical protein